MPTTLVTPSGKAHYPNVNEPNTTFKAEGVYKCDLIVSEEDAATFEEKLRDILNNAHQAECQRTGKKIRMATSFPVYQDDEGSWIIRAKQPAKVKAKNGKEYEFNVKIVDSKGQLTDVNVGSGSTLKMAVEPRTWFNPSLGFGMTLALKAVQVIELVEYSNGEEDFGFGEVEGGFVFEKEDHVDFSGSDETPAEDEESDF